MALFARGDFGDEFVQNVTGGVRIYLSDDPDKSLIDRHRKDDPKVYAPTFPTLAPGNTARQTCRNARRAARGLPAHRTASASAPPDHHTPAGSRNSGSGGYSCSESVAADCAMRLQACLAALFERRDRFIAVPAGGGGGA